METEMIFWRHATSPGIQVEEISGGEDKSPAIWKALALQVFGENGGDRFRIIGHSQYGAPVLEDMQTRISVSHTARFMVIAMLPRTPEADLTVFSQRTALGIDCEEVGRTQCCRVIGRVLDGSELALVGQYAATLEAGDANHKPMEAEEAATAAGVMAWTCKEALYKAALTPGLDFRKNLRIESLPEMCNFPTVRNPKYGKARIVFPEGCGVAETGCRECEMELFSYMSEGHIITLAYSPKCSKFKKTR